MQSHYLTITSTDMLGVKDATSQPQYHKRSNNGREKGKKEGYKVLSEGEKKSKFASCKESWREAEEGGRGRTPRVKSFVSGPALSKGSCHIRKAPLSLRPPL